MLDPIWKIAVDSTPPSEWAKMLDLFSDANIYQTWSYGRVRWGEENLSHLVLKRDSEVLGMAQLRIVRPTGFKFGMAYLRWGPVCERRGKPLDPEVVFAMAHVLEEEYVNRRNLFLRVIPHAFVGTPRAATLQLAFSAFTPERLTQENTYRTLLLDLSLSPEELRKKFDPKWRNKLSGAERNHLKIIAGNTVEEFDIFCRVYQNMRDRKTFETTVDVEEFRTIQEDLSEGHRMRILICEDKGIPVAGLVICAVGDCAIYLLGATSDGGLHSKGAYLLQWTALQWLKENGTGWYDLGGIDPEGNPGVYNFKRGMSGSDVFQMSPLVASSSSISSVMAKAGMAMQRTFRKSSGAARLARTLKQLVTRN